MIIELSFALIGGVNLSLEKSWNIIKDLMTKYPQATWEKIVDYQKGVGKYLVRI